MQLSCASVEAFVQSSGVVESDGPHTERPPVEVCRPAIAGAIAVAAASQMEIESTSSANKREHCCDENDIRRSHRLRLA